MITRIREVRKAKGLTLEQVGALCDPPTTAQTIGRLETGTRTVSVKWLNRIALALGVKLLAAPLLVWIALGLVGASAEARATATLLAACPTAVNVFIQTRAFGVFARGAAEAVVAGTVLSALTLTLIAHFLS